MKSTSIQACHSFFIQINPDYYGILIHKRPFKQTQQEVRVGRVYFLHPDLTLLVKCNRFVTIWQLSGLLLVDIGKSAALEI